MMTWCRISSIVQQSCHLLLREGIFHISQGPKSSGVMSAKNSSC